jgi:5-dehydro-4-deoxyglucarate dehydratase
MTPAPGEGRGWGPLWGFPLTPFSATGVALDELAGGAAHQIAGGVDVLVACGVIAQLEQLTPPEWSASVRTVVETSAGRAPVIATVTADAGAPDRAATAAELGADGLLLIPSEADPAAMVDTARSLSTVAPGLPQVVYHRPPLRLDPAAHRRLADVEAVRWCKDGHRDVRLFRQLAAAAPHIRWVSAWEDVAAAFWALGCRAFAPFSAAYAPAYSRAWYGLLAAGDLPGARRLLEAHAHPFVDLRLSRPGIDVSAVKAAMELWGLPAGSTRPPAAALTAPELATTRRLLEAMTIALDELQRAGEPPSSAPLAAEAASPS